MGELAGQYPEDMTAAAIYAEALMNTMPWNYWSDDGIAKPETSAVIDSLDRVLVKEPDHPLALHLYIHALEASNDPGRAEAAADRLANLVPGAGHLVHMPSHIYYRIGRYNDAAEANIKAADVDEAYIASCNAQGFYPALYYPHNIHFLWAASTMQGQSALSIESARRVVANVRVEQVKAFPTVEFFRTVPLLSLVRFGKWDEILAEPHPHEGFMFAKSIWHYARGVAFSAQGQTSDAKAELGALIPLKDDVSVRFLDSRDYPGSMLVGIAIELLQGEIAYRQGDYDIAIEHFEQAVATQDLLPYTEPPFWYYPTRQSLGAALLANGQLTEAEAVFRRDLELYPHNGWSMFGLAQSLEAQGKSDEADEVRHHFDAAWQFADIELSGAIL
jgi:tetratricopeptide (TPR) repeat protein